MGEAPSPSHSAQATPRPAASARAGTFPTTLRPEAGETALEKHGPQHEGASTAPEALLPGPRGNFHTFPSRRLGPDSNSGFHL